MPKLNWIMVAHGASLDRDSGQVTIFKSLDQMTMQGNLPVPKEGTATRVGPPFVCVASWSREDRNIEEAGSTRVSIRSPAGKVLGQSDADMPLVGPKQYWKHIMTLDFLPFVGLGDYSFVAECKDGDKWVEKGNTVLHVVSKTD